MKVLGMTRQVHPQGSLTEDGAMSFGIPATVVPRMVSRQCFRDLAGLRITWSRKSISSVQAIYVSHTHTCAWMYAEVGACTPVHTVPQVGRQGGKVNQEYSLSSDRLSWTDACCSQLGAPADEKAPTLDRAA